MRNPYWANPLAYAPFKRLPDIEATFKVTDHKHPAMIEFEVEQFREVIDSLKAVNAMKAERVIFNPPATIVIWKDGTKTVVKAQDDCYDRMTGVALCYMKKALGNTSRALNDALRAARIGEESDD